VRETRTTTGIVRTTVIGNTMVGKSTRETRTTTVFEKAPKYEMLNYSMPLPSSQNIVRGVNWTVVRKLA
jgi:hypothetical protein